MTAKKVLIVGSGAREHALAWKMAQSPKVAKVFVAPGNPGTHKIAENISIQPNNTKDLLKFAKTNHIDLTIVGPDEPLSRGIVDLFFKNNLKIFGPTKKAAKIEWSKSYAKRFMKKYSIPTADFKVFSTDLSAIEYLKSQTFPIVIKVSGLALGKGVFICQNLTEAKKALKNIFIDKVFGEAGNKVVIENYLEGKEISIHALSSGKDFLLFPPAQDHKRIYNSNLGPNTGGMGTFAPVPWVSQLQLEEIAQSIVKLTLDSLKKEAADFNGCLFPGLMLTTNGPKVLEFNARFGDPETQSYIRLLDMDLLELLESCLDGTLNKNKIKWQKSFALTVVLAAKGYPGKIQTGKVISGLEKAEKCPGVVIFHAGTKFSDNQLLTAGGRVLSVTAVAENLESARRRVYQAIKLIHFDGMQFRTDIGLKSLSN